MAHTVVNFLTSLSVANGGVAEILPFIRYISTYIDMEFSQIQGQDEGKGVVCAETWIMPAALVPRPWDFADPPSSKEPVHSSTPGATPPPQAGDMKPGVPGVVVTPPTPPASESLGKSAGTVTTEGSTSKAAGAVVPANGTVVA